MKYVKLYEDFEINETEELFKDIINFNLIQEAKDMSLDYLDDGLTLYIGILYLDEYLYVERFSHQIDSKKWYNSNEDNIDYIVSDYVSENDLTYRFLLIDDGETQVLLVDASISLLERLLDEYTNYKMISDKGTRFTNRLNGVGIKLK